MNPTPHADGVATPTTAADDTPSGEPESPRAYVFDVADVPGHTNAELLGGLPNADELFELLGRDLVTRALVQTPQLCVYHESAQPGERVKPHRHGTYQVDYVLRGELVFGNQRVTAGMGYFTPDLLYSWRAGPEGAEWIEIHSGIGGIYTDRAEG
ncbi:MAG TPA: cupin domain-containing protein [Acidimicrobiia bacterium]|nr:cupin domain-containing protein [Acidimicrobiia bacterium]